MKASKQVAGGPLVKKLLILVLGFCCFLFMLPGPVLAETTAG